MCNPVEECRQIVATLPQVQRQALRLVCVEGLSYAAAAVRLKVDVATLIRELLAARLAIAEIESRPFLMAAE